MTTKIPQLSREQQDTLKPATARIAEEVASDLGGALAGEFGEDRTAFLDTIPLPEPPTFDAL